MNKIKHTHTQTDAKEIEILDQAGIISNLKKQLQEHDNVVLKFRILAKNQQEEIAQLRYRRKKERKRERERERERERKKN